MERRDAAAARARRRRASARSLDSLHRRRRRRRVLPQIGFGTRRATGRGRLVRAARTPTHDARATTPTRRGTVERGRPLWPPTPRRADGARRARRFRALGQLPAGRADCADLRRGVDAGAATRRGQPRGGRDADSGLEPEPRGLADEARRSASSYVDSPPSAACAPSCGRLGDARAPRARGAVGAHHGPAGSRRASAIEPSERDPAAVEDRRAAAPSRGSERLARRAHRPTARGFIIEASARAARSSQVPSRRAAFTAARCRQRRLTARHRGRHDGSGDARARRRRRRRSRRHGARRPSLVGARRADRATARLRAGRGGRAAAAGTNARRAARDAVDRSPQRPRPRGERRARARSSATPPAPPERPPPLRRRREDAPATSPRSPRARFARHGGRARSTQGCAARAGEAPDLRSPSARDGRGRPTADGPRRGGARAGGRPTPQRHDPNKRPHRPRRHQPQRARGRFIASARLAARACVAGADAASRLVAVRGDDDRRSPGAEQVVHRRRPPSTARRRPPRRSRAWTTGRARARRLRRIGWMRARTLRLVRSRQRLAAPAKAHLAAAAPRGEFDRDRAVGPRATPDRPSTRWLYVARVTRVR